MKPLLPPKLRPLVPLALSFALLAGVSLLPPDTAFEEVAAEKRLTVCAPRELAPLVTRNKDKPGFEIELVKEVASRLGWTVSVTQSLAMGTEYNPGNWRLSRGTCRVIVGGIRDGGWSRSLMELSTPYLQSQWAIVSKSEVSWPPQKVGFAPGAIALDRVALGRILMEKGIEVVPMAKFADLAKALEQDEISVAISEMAVARATFSSGGYVVAPLPEAPKPTGFSFGFWKGDTTLKWEFDSVLAAMAKDGSTAKIARDYDLESAVLN